MRTVEETRNGKCSCPTKNKWLEIVMNIRPKSGIDSLQRSSASNKLGVALLFLWLSVGSSLARAAEVTPSQLLANPTKFDGQHVSVSGTAQYVRQKTSRRGNEYETFSLCDQACVNMFTWGHPNVAEGKLLLVQGTFTEVKRVGRYTFLNEIEADEGSL
jgi:hypothetical protein